ncbi:tRNA (adenosine(37)-N6)-threonylcarbamoyltransferase complex dimerization subunit type 1 TsaB [Amycolatopsis nigrescens]|uniref:tRNA (adenosine(37)-N6)-threonylcarbamoyltransferase complex dimerization subunit type 1 TsaB n=1 Tax=Amycolatopsis nigrescens TaxID=381445 RepID=UPI000372B0EB|nr:tRNA (adenosine(37)-N6)-threonylcarbamoyltransferase complex dimerization subunit type 1 TsaB [Amycolatopsis nigrescens]
MLVLAIDTSTPAVTAGIATLTGDEVTRITATRVTLDARAHGELLTPHILDAAAESGVALTELDAIVCGVGPGPFTGLRAGMATAAALGHGLGIPVHPVCGLDAIAAEVPAGEPFLVLTDARRREVYWAAYDADGVRTDGPQVQRPAELATAARLAVGDGARQYAETLGTLGLRVSEPSFPGPAGLVAVARPGLLAGREPAPLTPLYLRRPDATEPGAPKKVTAS